MTEPVIVDVALAAFAGSIAWMAVLLKRAWCPWVSTTVSRLLDGAATDIR